LKIDEKGKLWLSHKACVDDPWTSATEKWPVGSIHRCKVVRLTDFGAFIQMEPGIDGLCHVADLSFARIEHPKEVTAEGKEIDVIVAFIDHKAKKVTLHPAPPEDERDVPLIKRLQKFSKVDVVVTQIHDRGLGVRIVGMTGRYARAFIHAGQTGTPRGTDLRKPFPLGKKLQAKVIDIDNRRGGEARLSIRALKEDAEKNAYREYRKSVQREASFGTFGDLLKGKLGS
jgi:small subunit ribosomal protein S1